MNDLRPLRAGNRFWGFKRSEDGSTAVEFAFVGGPLIFLLMVIFETSLMLLSEYAVQQATADVARQIRTGQVQKANVGQADLKTMICSELPAYLTCGSKLHVDVRTWTAFDQIASQSGLTTDADGNTIVDPQISQNAQYQPGGPLEIVSVQVFYDWELFTPLISKLANLSGGHRLLTTGAVFRNEPFAN